MATCMGWDCNQRFCLIMNVHLKFQSGISDMQRELSDKTSQVTQLSQQIQTLEAALHTAQ